MKIKVKLPKDKTVDATTADIDLDEEVVLRKDGSRYTEADAQADAADVVERLGRGKPSLSGQGTSPQIGVRLPSDLRELLADRAAREGRRESEIVREAIVRYLSA